MSIARLPIFDSAAPEVAGPFRFEGRARLVLDRDALARQVAGTLRRAAHPSAIDEDSVRDYAAGRGLPHHRFETALLCEAFKVVSVDKLIEQLTGGLRERMPRTLETPINCTADQRDGVLLLRLGTDPAAEPSYVIVGDQPEWTELPGYANAAGRLSLMGELEPTRGRPIAIDAGWQVEPGVTCAAFGENAATCFAAPLRALVGCLAGEALGRFARVMPREVAAVLGDTAEPTFVNVERLLRFGRLTQQTRVYLLYWKRLRDYLVWSVTDSGI